MKNSIIYELNSAWNNNFSYRELLGVIKKHSLQKLGEGSSRMVFKLDDSTCIKIAKNKFGISQMKEECDISDKGDFDVFVKVFAYDKKYNIWSICELCSEATNADFKRILMVPFSIIEVKIEDFIYDFKESNYEEIDSEFEKSKPAVLFMKNLINAIRANSLEDTAYDLEMIENYGVTSDDKIKVIDFGLTNKSMEDVI